MSDPSAASRSRANVDPSGSEPTQADAASVEVNAEALLVALVLVPNSYPRNRFFSLFEQPEARHARRRAALLRSLSEEIRDGVSQLQVVRQAGSPNGSKISLSYTQPELFARRQTLLDDDELALLQLVVERAGHSCDGLQLADHDPQARDRVQRRLLALLR